MSRMARTVSPAMVFCCCPILVLLLCTLSTLWLQERQFAIRQTLHQVKLLARDVLASLDQGVITTDQQGIITSVNSAALRFIPVEKLQAEGYGQYLALFSNPDSSGEKPGSE